MPIYEIAKSAIRKLGETTFSGAGIRERADLQRLLRSHIDVISPDTLVVAEEFGQWDESRRRIDLLGLDRAANIVVIELKRTEDGGHMGLQAIRYAAMVSTLTFEKVIEVYAEYLRRIGQEADARTSILEFLGRDPPLYRIGVALESGGRSAGGLVSTLDHPPTIGRETFPHRGICVQSLLPTPLSHHSGGDASLTCFTTLGRRGLL